MAENRMTAFMGTFEYFTPGDDFDTYLLRLKHFLSLNDFTTEEKKKSFLITSIGSDVCKTIANLIQPVDIDTKKYDELIEVIKKHIKPVRNEIAESYKFYKRFQGAEESVADYVVDLKFLASSCNFGQFQTRALRDALVLGVYSDETKRK